MARVRNHRRFRGASRTRGKTIPTVVPADRPAESAVCPICDRALVPGPSVDRHHWRPASHGGRDSSLIHVVCHRMIHRLFSEADLAAGYDSAAALREHPDMRRFRQWIGRQPDTYVDWPRTPKGGQTRSRSRRHR